MQTDLEIKLFSPGTESDAIEIANAYLAGWPYCRPLDVELVAYWKTLGAAYQPGHMLLAYRGGAARVFLHGERDGDQHFVHLLAMAPAAVDEGVWLLRLAEEQARAEGAKRLCGPTCQSGKFYGGYVLGLEPYHPHWATDGTEAFVQAGFVISQSEALMVAELSQPIDRAQAPAGYEIVEAEAEPEFQARTFRLAACFEGKEVATCGGRLYARLTGPGGGPIGQLGFVGTKEAHRGRGLATALGKLALARLQEWGAAEALVSTGLENRPALRAYERAGFRRRHNLNEWSKLLE